MQEDRPAIVSDQRIGCGVIIVTHKRPQILKRTLASLRQCRLPDGPVEVFVLENGDPESGSKALCAEAKLPVPINYQYVPDKRKTVSVNLAIGQARSEFLCLFDDDVRLDVDCLTAYHDAARRWGRGHFFGGPHETEGGTPPPGWLRRHLPVSAFPWGYSGDEGVLSIDGRETVFMGFNWAAFKRDIVAAGGFPEFPPSMPSSGGGDETVMQRRLLAAGVKAVYVPQARAWHYVPERDCSYEFAVQRSRFAGRNLCVIEGLENPTLPHAMPPRWLLKRLAWLHARKWVSKLNRLPQEQRLTVDCELSYALGTLEGLRILRTMARNDEIDRF